MAVGVAVKSPRRRYNKDVAPKAVVQESTAAFGVYRDSLEQFAWTLGYVEKEELEKMHPFKLARVQKVKSEDKITWFIQYYVFDIQKGKLVRKRHRVPTEYQSEAEKKAYSHEYIKKVNKLLKQGYHIDRQKVEERKEVQEEKKFYTLEEALKAYVKNCERRQLYKTGIEESERTIARFIKWLNKKGFRNRWIGELNEKIAKAYFEYLLDERKNSPKTHNNSLGILKAFYNRCLHEEWVDKPNPFLKIEKLPEEYGTKNLPFTQFQIQEMKEYMQEKDPYLWFICSFIYYTMMRPSEIRRIQVKDVDMERRRIIIHGRNAKGKKRDLLPIVPALYEQLLQFQLEKCNPTDFLFGCEHKPSSEKMGENYMGKHFKKVKNHFNLHKDHTLYGFKHTAVCNWYKVEKDIVKISKMCRHCDIKMTERYLKSLGLLNDENQVALLPEI